LKLKQVEAWDIEKPETMGKSARMFRLAPYLDKSQVALVKRSFEHKKAQEKWLLVRTLEHYRWTEELLREDVTGIDLEFKLEAIAGLCGVRKRKIFHGIANCFDDFNQDQRHLLLSFLNRIIENSPRATRLRQNRMRMQYERQQDSSGKLR